MRDTQKAGFLHGVNYIDAYLHTGTCVYIDCVYVYIRCKCQFHCGHYISSLYQRNMKPQWQVQSQTSLPEAELLARRCQEMRRSRLHACTLSGMASEANSTVAGTIPQPGSARGAHRPTADLESFLGVPGCESSSKTWDGRRTF